VHESLGALWVLSLFYRATGDRAAGKAMGRAAEFFFERKLFKSRRTGEVIEMRTKAPAPWLTTVLH
jgi:hypothetical protein